MSPAPEGQAWGAVVVGRRGEQQELSSPPHRVLTLGGTHGGPGVLGGFCVSVNVRVCVIKSVRRWRIVVGLAVGLTLHTLHTRPTHHPHVQIVAL